MRFSISDKVTSLIDEAFSNSQKYIYTKRRISELREKLRENSNTPHNLDDKTQDHRENVKIVGCRMKKSNSFCF